MTVTVTVPAGISATTLRRWSRTARRRLPGLRGSVSVVAVSPAVSRRLNRTYRGLNRPTNVLSFVTPAAQPTGEPTAGEIILCPAVIRREAAGQGRAYRPYVRFLIQHGLIHLLGFDHRTVAEQRRWQRWERRLQGKH